MFAHQLVDRESPQREADSSPSQAQGRNDKNMNDTRPTSSMKWSSTKGPYAIPSSRAAVAAISGTCCKRRDDDRLLLQCFQGKANRFVIAVQIVFDDRRQLGARA